MKKFSLFLISITLFWGIIRLLRKTNLHVFTPREQEILNLIVMGYKDNEIAELLHMSGRSIRQYESNILRKTKMHDISYAIQYALNEGLLRIDYA